MDDDKITALKQTINNFIHEHGPDAMTLKQAEHAACVLLEAFLEAQGAPVVTFPDGEPKCSHDYEARDSDGRLYCSRCKQYLDE
jgi:hypothetical protein